VVNVCSGQAIAIWWLVEELCGWRVWSRISRLTQPSCANRTHPRFVATTASFPADRRESRNQPR
jgi:hypothetical protein